MASQGTKRKEVSSDEDDEQSSAIPSGSSNKRNTSAGDVSERHADKSEGIGVIVSHEGRGFVIERVIEGGSAARMGVNVGDRIVAVDGRDVGGLSIFQLAGQIRGKVGTTVSLTLVSPTLDTRNITVARGKPEPAPKDAPNKQLIDWDAYITHEGELTERRELCTQRAKQIAGFFSFFRSSETVEFPRIDEVCWRLLTDEERTEPMTFEQFLEHAPANASADQLILAYEKMSMLARCRNIAATARKEYEAKIAQLTSHITDLEHSQSAENKTILIRLNNAIRLQETTQKQMENAKSLLVKESTEHEVAKRTVLSLERQLAVSAARVEEVAADKRALQSEIAALAAAVQRVRDPLRAPPASDNSLSFLKDMLRMYTAHLQQQQQQQQTASAAAIAAAPPQPPPQPPPTSIAAQFGFRNLLSAPLTSPSHISSEIAFGNSSRLGLTRDPPISPTLPQLLQQQQQQTAAGASAGGGGGGVSSGGLSPTKKVEECVIS